MQLKIRASIFLTLIVSLLLLLAAFPANVLNADDSSQDFAIKASSIYQNSKLIVSQWDTEYSYQSREDLDATTGSGRATSGTYSNTVPGGTLKTEELPYFGHTGVSFFF